MASADQLEVGSSFLQRATESEDFMAHCEGPSMKTRDSWTDTESSK